MERLERVSYALYNEMRLVADYAYLNVRLEADPETIKRVPGIRTLTDDQALKAGLTAEDIVALKFKQRFLAARCRADIFEIAKFIADERLRDPVQVQAEERETA